MDHIFRQHNKRKTTSLNGEWLFRIDENGVGAAVWHLYDFASDKDIAKARCFNNKGIMNEYRKPKLAYHALKQLYKNN